MAFARRVTRSLCNSISARGLCNSISACDEKNEKDNEGNSAFTYPARVSWTQRRARTHSF